MKPMDLNKQILQVKEQLESQFREISDYKRNNSFKRSIKGGSTAHNFVNEKK